MAKEIIVSFRPNVALIITIRYGDLHFEVRQRTDKGPDVWEFARVILGQKVRRCLHSYTAHTNENAVKVALELAFEYTVTKPSVKGLGK